MTDPERFKMSGSDLERRLFASMDDDAPPPAARARLLAALSTAAALSATENAAAATAASKGAHGVGWFVLAKWTTAGAAAAFVTVGTGVVLSNSGRAIPPAPVLTAPAVRSAATAAPHPAALAPTATLSEDAHDRSERESTAQARDRFNANAPSAHVRPSGPASEMEPPRSSPAVPNAPPPASDLAREVAILDDVQKTLDGGDARGALRRLDLYAATFPAPSLGPEATLLRVQALLASGDRSGAESLGRAFIARSPRSQHAERIQSLLAPDVAPAERFLDQNSRARTQPR